MLPKKGQLVLVTGATGFIGAHVVEELIAAGYSVRATSRSQSKATFLVRHAQQKFGAGLMEVVQVPDMVAPNAYDSAVQGVSGIVHLTSVLTLSSQPDEVIAPTVEGTLSILRAAAKEPKVKSVVVTSSSTAVYNLSPNHRFTVTKDTWNEDALEQIKMPSPDAYTIYSASKV